MVQGDATHWRGVDERRRRSEEHPHPLIHFVSDIITVLEADGTVRFESPSVERVLGYRPEESARKNAFDNIHPEDLERVTEAFAEVLAEGGSTRRMELRVRHADGSWRHFESIGSNLLDNPSVGGIVVTSRDITERKEAEEALKASEERYRAVVGSGSPGFV
jgi:PAS domain S-box-containing protein